MDWMTCLQQAITYMEQHLLDELHPENIAEAVHVSPFYLQRGFQILTGCSLMEYVRNRRLYLAAMEAVDSNIKIIDLAYKYGYQTPESLQKLFTAFMDIHRIKCVNMLNVSLHFCLCISELPYKEDIIWITW